MKKATLYKIDGEILDITPEKTFTLEQMQKYVGGRIEIITFPSGNLLIVNEEGKIGFNVVNNSATEEWYKEFPKGLYEHISGDYVAGNAIICTSDCLE